MRAIDVKEAVSLAKRFVNSAQEWLALDYHFREITSTEEGGALRRASMDLTRALARMRGRE